MGENAAALHTAVNSVQALGRGFDVNFDTRLLYCKGAVGTRILELDEDCTRDICLYDEIVVPGVSRDIRHSQEAGGRQSSGVCSFHEMVEYFNQKSNASGSFPLGSFNFAFSFTGSKHIDAAATKTLCVDGFYIPLAKVQLFKSPIVLQEHVKQAVPSSWDPASLARTLELKGSQIQKAMELQGGDPGLFNSQGIYPQPTSAPYLAGKEDVTVIFRRRGGDDLEQNHTQWARTVCSSPDVIEMTFFPIAALLEEIPGKEHLTRAIGLYLEYKPPLEELRYFLEFQISRIWAPVYDRNIGHQRKEPVCPSLQFSIMGQKLYVSQEQVTVKRKPVTGLRLYLEGSKQNRLCIHLQHLASLPKILQPYWDSDVAIGAPKWQGPEEQDSRWFEPVKWKNFSHVSTAPIENPETFIGDLSGVYIVTGAQLGVWDFGSRNVLYMKLSYSRLPGCTVRRSLWDHTPNEKSKKATSTGDSSSGSREHVAGNKLVKVVDMSEMSKGPRDHPGHWLVTGEP
ncbi:hypothetical protein C1H46_041181 [Malus baccata]|uniref:MACPF domain-containing protein n=1 Tax=Malus baccata TaxID=106549 RepID=A0A540KGD2_MALBA|nr:hypothetical protein C1H46_041181 [Malus baccata]